MGAFGMVVAIRADDISRWGHRAAPWARVAKPKALSGKRSRFVKCRACLGSWQSLTVEAATVRGVIACGTGRPCAGMLARYGHNLRARQPCIRFKALTFQRHCEFAAEFP